LQILRLLMDGRSNKEMASALELSVDTVKFHLKHLYRQLHAKSRAEAVMAGTKLGYLEWVNNDAAL
jgi:DNA-binding CsgD family transcriptional regulator